MLNRLKCRTLIFIIIPLILSGCSMFFYNREKAQSMVNQAREHFDALKSLDAEKSYPEDFAKTEQMLNKSEKYLKSGSGNKAYEEALGSLKISKKILKQFYLDTISELARKAREELKLKTGGDPDNPLMEYISNLDRITKDAEKIEDNQQFLSLDKIIKDLEEVLMITRSIKTNISKILASDVSFDKGEYILSGKGRNVIKEFFNEIFKNMSLNSENEKMTLKIKVVGYTDKLNFGKESSLLAKLSQEVEGEIPLSDPERREFFNQRLSKLRAETIGMYINELVQENMPENLKNVKMHLETVGLGEKIPINLPQPWPVSDSRRRICKIHVYTTTL